MNRMFCNQHTVISSMPPILSNEEEKSNIIQMLRIQGENISFKDNYA